MSDAQKILNMIFSGGTQEEALTRLATIQTALDSAGYDAVRSIAASSGQYGGFSGVTLIGNGGTVRSDSQGFHVTPPVKAEAPPAATGLGENTGAPGVQAPSPAATGNQGGGGAGAAGPAQEQTVDGTIPGFDEGLNPFQQAVQGQLVWDAGIDPGDPQGREPRGPLPFMWTPGPAGGKFQEVDLNNFAINRGNEPSTTIMDDHHGNLYTYDGTTMTPMKMPAGYITAGQVMEQARKDAASARWSVSEQARLNREQQKTQFDETMLQKADALTAQTNQYLSQNENALKELDLLRDQLRVAEAAGIRASAIAIEGVIEQQNARLDANEVARAQITNAAQQLQVQLNASAQEGNVSRLFAATESRLNRVLTAAGMVENARQFNITERRNLASQAAELMRSPEDVGAVFGFLEGASGGPGKSPLSTAIAQGQSGVTDLSLTPLATNIEAMQQLNRGNPQFDALLRDVTGAVDPTASQFNQQAPTVPTPALPDVEPPRPQFTIDSPRFKLGEGREIFDASGKRIGATERADAATIFDEAQQRAFAADPTGQALRDVSDEGFLDILLKTGALTEDTKGLAHGGVLDTKSNEAVVVGDDPSGKPTGHEELAVPLGNGKVMIVPLNGKKAPKGAKKAATGGIFDFNSGLLELDDPEGSIAAARAQLERALQFGFQRTGLSSLPTPIQFATPGRSRYAQRTASGLAALRGFPSELFLEEADRLTPRGIPSGGRTTSGRTR